MISESLIQISESDNAVNSSLSILRIYIPRDPDESNYTCVAVNNITNILDTPENDNAELYVQGMCISFTASLLCYRLYRPY